MLELFTRTKKMNAATGGQKKKSEKKLPIGEAALTLGARKRFLSCMGSDVSLQMVL
jgi:hypothetical protein